jgi:predicted nucleic acid-binding protein
MMKFLDASVLVEACLEKSPLFEPADALVAKANATSAHALAEAYATLSGDKRLRINPHDAADMVSGCASVLRVEGLDTTEMAKLIQAAPVRRICGGSFFDAIHAQVARKIGCKVVVTLNPSHFRHVAPDLDIEAPSSLSDLDS